MQLPEVYDEIGSVEHDEPVFPPLKAAVGSINSAKSATEVPNQTGYSQGRKAEKQRQVLFSYFPNTQ